MKWSRLTMGAASALVLSLLLASAALASGPGNGSGRSQLSVTCDGVPYRITVNNGNGTGQVVDALGHAILVNGRATFTDTKVNQVLASWDLGHGSGHANQAQTLCTSDSNMTVAALGTPPPGGWGSDVSDNDPVVLHFALVLVLKV